MGTRSDIRNEFLGDIVICIAEDFGYNSWRQVTSYHWFEDDPKRNVVGLYDVEEEKDLPTIGVNEVATGIARILDGKIKVRDSIIKQIREASEENDAGIIDAELADIILQAYAFNDYVYG